MTAPTIRLQASDEGDPTPTGSERSVGRWASWGKWAALLVWIGVAAVTAPYSSRLTGAEKNDALAYLPSSAESTRAFSAVLQVARSQSGPLAEVVYARPSGLTPADTQKVLSDKRALAAVGAAPVAGPVPSADGRASLLLVTLASGSGSDQARVAVQRMHHIIDDGLPAGLQVKVTGTAGVLADLSASFTGNGSAGLTSITLLVVAIILFLTYRSPVLWILPLVTVTVAYFIADAALYVLATRAGLVVSGSSAGILPALMFGAGTDYALLVIARYREELHRHRDRHQAMLVALRRAGPAIVASAATVTLGLLCLLAAQLSSNRGLGPVAAIGILCVLLAMTTLLPALLLIFGRWLFWPARPRVGAETGSQRTLWARAGRAIDARRRPIWLGTAAVLAVLIVGLSQARLGLSSTQAYRTPPESVQGMTLISAHYPSGIADPALIVANAGAAGDVVAAANGVRGVAEVSTPVRAGDRSLVSVVLSDPPDSRAAEDTIVRLRAAVHAIPGAGALVGGDVAGDLDLREATLHDEEVVIPLVLAVVLGVLMLLLRALVGPLLLLGTVALSFFSALGLSAALFTRALGFGAIDYSVPLLGFVFLVALGVDYNIFLMTRVREEVAALGHHRAVLRGLAVTGGVITSAGLVLAATFAVLGTLNLVVLAELGILVTIGVLLDTFVVRSVLVPALALDIGPTFWWPTTQAGAPGPASETVTGQ